MEIDYTLIGQRIKEARKKKGWSQENEWKSVRNKGVPEEPYRFAPQPTHSSIPTTSGQTDGKPDTSHRVCHKKSGSRILLIYLTMLQRNFN